MKVRQFQDIEPCLFELTVDSKSQICKGAAGLERAKQFFALLGNPQESYKSIHIAGTSGKGSTSYFVSHLLMAHGFKIGTHVSPHIYDVRERFMINMELISEDKAVGLLNKVLPAIRHYDKKHDRPTYYESTVGMCFCLFEDEQVDYAVIETGMGGLFDSTNTINRQDKLAVITRLGLDHTEILGDTIEQIATQKAGIMAHGGQSIAVKPREQSVSRVLEQTAAERRNLLTLYDPVELVSNVRITPTGVLFDYTTKTLKIPDITLNTLAEYQAENAALSLVVLETLSKRDGFSINPELVRQAFSETIIPARMELRHIAGRQILADGAHNPQKIETLIKSLKQYTDEPPVWLFAAKASKDVQSSLKEIGAFCDGIAFTEFFRDHPTRYLSTMSMSSSDLSQTWQKTEKAPVLGEFKHPADALKAILKQTSPEKLIVVSGSMYMIGELYAQLQRTP